MTMGLHWVRPAFCRSFSTAKRDSPVVGDLGETWLLISGSVVSYAFKLCSRAVLLLLPMIELFCASSGLVLIELFCAF